MSRTFVTLFLVLAIFTSAVLSQANGRPGLCRKNEVWSECSGHCQPSCANSDPICPFICKPGCVCKPDYLRNKNQKCIPQERCKSNEESSE